MELKFLTTAELAEMLRTTQETCRYWRQIGKGPTSVKVGKHHLYAAADVEKWLDSLKGTAA